mmetsp:Transcript_46421/g.81683  ORF Transcript_46421/g.81683 Transcript_46421/m.81683 type:complete len:450 (-) Transcript_46421:6-1355(-)
MALQRYDRFGAGENADVGGLPGLAAKKRRKRRALRWLGLLFLVTLLLLIFQVTLGWATNTLTLVADAAHGVADVVSYAFNFCVECLKKRGRSREDAEATTKMVDTWGSLISLVLLIFATIFAVAEAMGRFSEDVEEDSDRIGPALLFFSIMSTTCNTGLMLMYWHWHKKSGVKTPSANLSAGVILDDSIITVPSPPVTIGGSKLAPSLPSNGDIEALAPPVIEEITHKTTNLQDVSNAAAPALPPELPMLLGRPSRKREKDRKKGLNLCADFAGGETAAVGSEENCQKIGCPGPGECCRPIGEELADAPECPAGAVEGIGGGVLSALHRAVHPGCTCEHAEEDAPAGFPVMPATSGEGRNLNLVAAMLHLITDVLRGILILGIALLIMLGGVHDAGRADAVCALVVAALIAAGSIALLLRVAGRLPMFCGSRVFEKFKNLSKLPGNQNL